MNVVVKGAVGGGGAVSLYYSVQKPFLFLTH